MKLLFLSQYLPQLLLFFGMLPVVFGRPINLAGRTPGDVSKRQGFHQVERASSKSLPHLPFRHYPSENDDDELSVRALDSRCQDSEELPRRGESASIRTPHLPFKIYSSEKDDALEAGLCGDLRREKSDSNRVQVVRHLPFRNYPSETEDQGLQSHRGFRDEDDPEHLPLGH
ncbi:hypothetical protein C8R45DRAFT_966331 [Mycena sanguinolenta]|nr:hypothetical protein C8R45DRAFT_966331 [Mycena sanguinolenta]